MKAIHIIIASLLLGMVFTACKKDDALPKGLSGKWKEVIDAPGVSRTLEFGPDGNFMMYINYSFELAHTIKMIGFYSVSDGKLLANVTRTETYITGEPPRVYEADPVTRPFTEIKFSVAGDRMILDQTIRTDNESSKRRVLYVRQ